jgi:GNAT superfamily N-acetyltransferase
MFTSDVLLNRQRWPELESENMFELLVHMGSSPYAERFVSDEIAWAITGIQSNSLNGVAYARLDETNADPVILETLQRFIERQVWHLWYVSPDSTPPDLAQRLERFGCESLGPGVSMGADLSSLNEDERDVEGLAIKRVAEAADLTLWCDVYCGDEEDRPLQERILESLGFDQHRPLHHFLALLNGEPIGTSSLFLGQKVAGLYDVSVKEHARHKGIGTALALAALREARTSGYRVAVLGPTPDSFRMYQRIGFIAQPDMGERCYYLPDLKLVTPD